MRSRQAPSGGISYQVLSEVYNTERWASPDRLRPRWRFVPHDEAERLRTRGEEYHWEAVAPAGLEVHELAPAMRPDSAEGGMAETRVRPWEDKKKRAIKRERAGY